MRCIVSCFVLCLSLAAPAAELPELLTRIRNLKADDSRTALREIEDRVAETSRHHVGRKAAAEALLAAVPGSTPEARHFLLQQLRLVASSEQAPALVPLLKDPATSMDARATLELIPGEAAGKALLEALKDTEGAVAIGIVASLGVRRDAAAVPVIAPLLKAPADQMRRQAAWSLGQIATPAAAEALLAAELNRAVAEALAATLSAVKSDEKLVKAICTRLTEPANAEDIRVIGHAGLLSLGGGDACVAALADADKTRQAGAIAALRGMKDARLLVAASKHYTKVAPELKPILLALLAESAVAEAQPLFIAATTEDNRLLRRIGVEGLARVGSEQAVDPLLQAAEKMPAAELELLSAALAQIKGDAVNDKLIAALPAARPQMATVLTRALVERSDAKAVPALLKLTSAKDAKVAVEAIGGVGELAGPDAVGQLVPLLTTSHENAARSAIASICRRNGRDIAPLARAYDGAEAKLKQSLLKALPAVGGKEALALVRREAAGADAAVKTEAIRAMSVWTDGEPAEDLFAIAQKASIATDKTLALRGLAKLVPQSSLPKQKQVEMLIAAIGLATDQQTKGMLEATLKDVKTPAGEQGEAGPVGVAGGMKIVESPTSVTLMAGDTPVWKFEYDSKLGKPHFAVLAPVGGSSIARVSPADHIWHYGLWFSWKYLNKLNYWEEDKQHKSQGVNDWKNVKCRADTDGSATITLDLEYHPKDQPPILTEKRTLRISAPAADGSYQIDWTSAFTAGQIDVAVDRTPIPPEPGAQAWGGYAGLSLRMQQLTKHSVITEDGPVTFGPANRFRGPARAMDYSGELNGKMIGVAILDHPANLRHPSSWYAIRDGTMNFFNPAILIPGPHTLKAGDSLTLRYRVLVHHGALDKEALAKAAAEFK